MKTILSPSPTFNPAAKTLDFSGVSGFALNRLLAVIDQTKNQIIYATSSAGLGYTNFAANVLTLEKDTTTGGFSSGDSLTCVYDLAVHPVSITNTATSGITSTYYNARTAASLVPVVVKNGAATLFGITIIPNKVDTGVGCFPAYLKLYNTATPTVGGGSATTPLMTICLVDSTGATPNTYSIPSSGIAFSSALSFAITGTSVTADQTTPQAGHTITLNYI